MGKHLIRYNFLLMLVKIKKYSFKITDDFRRTCSRFFLGCWLYPYENRRYGRNCIYDHDFIYSVHICPSLDSQLYSIIRGIFSCNRICTLSIRFKQSSIFKFNLTILVSNHFIFCFTLRFEVQNKNSHYAFQDQKRRIY